MVEGEVTLNLTFSLADNEYYFYLPSSFNITGTVQAQLCKDVICFSVFYKLLFEESFISSPNFIDLILSTVFSKQANIGTVQFSQNKTSRTVPAWIRRANGLGVTECDECKPAQTSGSRDW